MADNPFSVATVSPATQTATTAVEAQRGITEIQARYLLARANPRDQMRATDLILQDCTRVTLAEAALYAYSRGGTDISGPSIRLMEAIAQRWGNIACGVKEVARHQGSSECLAYAHDLETGFYDERVFSVRHWRDTKRGGYAATDERDLYEIIANSGARRKRACLQAVIPGDVIEAAVKQCEETLHTKADTSPEAMKRLVTSFAEFGVSQAQIEARIQRRLEAIRPAQVVMLRRIWTSLRDEMSEPRVWFEPIPEGAQAAAGEVSEAPRSTVATGLQDRLRARRAARQPDSATEGGAPAGGQSAEPAPPASAPNEAAPPPSAEPPPADDRELL